MLRKKRFDWFDDTKTESNLRSKTITGGALVGLNQVGMMVVQLGSIIVLARILQPEDFGLFAMAATLTTFVKAFANFGLSQAVIQREKITQAHVSNLFWVNLAFGFFLFALCCAAAKPVSLFYGDPRLVSLILGAGASFPVATLPAMHRALMGRHMFFGRRETIVLISTLLANLGAIAIALVYPTYWVLLFREVGSSFFAAIFLWIACDWRPSLWSKTEKIGESISFGLNVAGFELVNYFNRNFDNILIGRLFGQAVLGQYNAAYRIILRPLSLVNGSIAKVMHPSLTRLREQPDRYANYYLMGLSVSSICILPIAAATTFFGPELVDLVLGPKWHQSGKFLIALSGVIAVQPVMNSAGWLYLSSGRTSNMLRWALFATPLIILGMLLGSRFGPTGIAYGLSLAYLALLPLGMFYATKGTPVSMLAVSKTFGVILFLAYLSIGLAKIISEIFVQSEFHATWSLAALFGGFLIYLISVVLTPQGKKSFRLLQELVVKKSG